jgi:radical SAM superfamily enzyme YgiQ (UPF0313 family)
LVAKPKIVLIHPPHPEEIEDRLDAPLGLLYIAGMLKSHNFEVSVNDLSGVPESKWKIDEGNLYGITVYAPSLGILEKITRLCKQVNPLSKVIVGGAHVTSAPYSINSLISRGLVHSVVLGEGELAMLKAATDYPELNGYYDIPLEKNLDSYPSPAFELVDLNSYRRTVVGKKTVSLLSSRGCNFRCTFCALAPHHRVLKFRSPETVYAEVRMLKDNYGFEAFNFQDDCLTTNKSRLDRLLELLTPLKIVFRCQGRAGTDSEEEYIKLKRAGCEIVACGIESGSQRILDRMHKKVSVLDNENAIKWAKQADITARAFFIFGFPGETAETIEETKQFIERTDPDQYLVASFVPFPGTLVWENPTAFGVTKIDRDFSKFYIIDREGYGGVCFETDVLPKDEFITLERDFRGWMKKRGMRRDLLEYEKRIFAADRNDS